MATQVGRLFVSLEAQTAAFEARMDAASQQVNRMTNSTVAARRGAMQLRGGLESLAFSGLGVLPPAAARAGAGLMAVFVGSPILLGIVAITAALGVLAMAFDRAGKKAQEMVKEAQRVRDFQLGQLKMLAGIGPGFQQTPGEHLATLETLRGRTLDWINQLTPLTQSVVAQLGGIDPVAVAAQRRIDALTESFRGLNRAIALINAEPAMERFNFMVSNLRSLTGFEFTRGGLRRGGFQAPGFGDSVAGMPARELRFLPRDPFAGISTHFGRGTTPAPERGARFRFTPELAQMLMLSMMAARGGGVGGGLLALGGITTGLSGAGGIAGTAAAGPLGWAGFGLSALGSIAGLFTSNADKNAEKVVKAIERMGKEVGLERVTVVFTGPDGHQVRRSLAQLEDSDAVERMPGPVGAGG